MGRSSRILSLLTPSQAANPTSHANARKNAPGPRPRAVAIWHDDAAHGWSTCANGRWIHGQRHAAHHDSRRGGLRVGPNRRRIRPDLKSARRPLSGVISPHPIVVCSFAQSSQSSSTSCARADTSRNPFTFSEAQNLTGQQSDIGFIRMGELAFSRLFRPAGMFLVFRQLDGFPSQKIGFAGHVPA